MANCVSLCLIVRNGEATLPDCLRSAAGLVHETVVVDTGSTDATKQVAASLGARVFDFPWCDSFAAARNESIRHAQGDWIFVVQNLAGQGRRLRQLLGPRPRLLFWSGHGAEQPAVQPLCDAAERAAYDGFVLVSAWQRGRYLAAFGLDPDKTVVLGNGISPAFENLFGPEESIVAAKSWPPVLAYTSTPDRGLDLLLEAFPRIRAAVPGTTLEVYAGLRLYGFSDAEDQARYGALYQRCRETAGVELIGPVSQPELARRLRRTAVLAYPNTVPETYCIAAREALAAGCVVVSTALGALPETTAGFARLLPPADRAAYLERFTSETADVLNSLVGQEEGLRRQVTAILRESTWARLADRWVESLTPGALADAHSTAPTTAMTG